MSRQRADQEPPASSCPYASEHHSQSNAQRHPLPVCPCSTHSSPRLARGEPSEEPYIPCTPHKEKARTRRVRAGNCAGQEKRAKENPPILRRAGSHETGWPEAIRMALMSFPPQSARLTPRRVPEASNRQFDPLLGHAMPDRSGSVLVCFDPKRTRRGFHLAGCVWSPALSEKRREH